MAQLRAVNVLQIDVAACVEDAGSDAIQEEAMTSPALMRAAAQVASAGALSEESKGKRLLIFTNGSRGDVQPFAALASALQTVGFVVRVLTNVNHVSFMETFGLDAVGANMDAELCVREDPAMQKMMAEGKMLKLASNLAELNKKSFSKHFQVQLQAARSFQPEVILASSMELTQARAIAGALNVPVITCQLTCMHPSGKESSMLGEPLWLPGWCHLAAWRVMVFLWLAGEKDGKYAVLREQLPGCETLLPQNSEQALLFFNKPVEPQLCGVSASVVKCRSDWDQPPVLTGFWVVNSDEQHKRMLAGDASFGGTTVETVDHFLQRGEPPAYLGWGSMLAVSPEHMTCLAVRALRRAGLRGVVLGGWAKLSAEMLEGQPDSEELKAYAADNVLFISTAPHEWLFPRCAVIVHHGGSGTTAAALRSGRPSVVTPCAFDQFANAQMVAEGGAGIALRQFSKVSAADLAAALTRAATDEQMTRKAKKLGEKLRREDGLGAAVMELDHFVSQELVTGKWEARARAQQEEFRKLAQPSLLTRLSLCCSFICGSGDGNSSSRAFPVQRQLPQGRSSSMKGQIASKC
mmetsp:Transcript_22974/g.61194  ORF Transcript_22974/g.61194 Transcript_22974/m.61194 type:complete len:579 (-) Transcript_22974:108-1844(-)